nr:U-box domain-containing protein 35-like [Ipomoea batatas]
MLGPIGLEEERSVVAVAIDRNDKHSFYALQWTTDVLLSKGQTLTLIHVNESSLAKPIPSGNSDFSNGGQDPDDPSTDVFLPYRLFCSSRQSPNSGTRLLNNRSEVASTVMKGAPGYCSVYTIAKGNKVASAREATHPLKSSMDRIFQNVPERKLISSASYMCRSRAPDEVVIHTRLSTDISLSATAADSSLLAFHQNLPSSPGASSFSSYARRKNNGNNFTRGGLVDSGEQKLSAVDDDDENSLPSSPTMTKELENLCKEMEKKLREVEREKMEALAMFEKVIISNFLKQ